MYKIFRAIFHPKNKGSFMTQDSCLICYHTNTVSLCLSVSLSLYIVLPLAFIASLFV